MAKELIILGETQGKYPARTTREPCTNWFSFDQL